MKKISLIFIALSFALLFIGCGNNNEVPRTLMQEIEILLNPLV